MTDLDRARLYVADDRRQESLDGFWAHLAPTELAAIEAVAMDMWEPYITSTRAHLPDAAPRSFSTSSTLPSTQHAIYVHLGGLDLYPESLSPRA